MFFYTELDKNSAFCNYIFFAFYFLKEFVPDVFKEYSVEPVNPFFRLENMIGELFFSIVHR
jgi:hypothetical protein